MKKTGKSSISNLETKRERVYGLTGSGRTDIKKRRREKTRCVNGMEIEKDLDSTELRIFSLKDYKFDEVTCSLNLIEEPNIPLRSIDRQNVQYLLTSI